MRLTVVTTTLQKRIIYADLETAKRTQTLFLGSRFPTWGSAGCKLGVCSFGKK